MKQARYVPFQRRQIGEYTVAEYRPGWYQILRGPVPLKVGIPFWSMAVEIAERMPATV